MQKQKKNRNKIEILYFSSTIDEELELEYDANLTRTEKCIWFDCKRVNRLNLSRWKLRTIGIMWSKHDKKLMDIIWIVVRAQWMTNGFEDNGIILNGRTIERWIQVSKAHWQQSDRSNGYELNKYSAFYLKYIECNDEDEKIITNLSNKVQRSFSFFLFYKTTQSCLDARNETKKKSEKWASGDNGGTRPFLCVRIGQRFNSNSQRHSRSVCFSFCVAIKFHHTFMLVSTSFYPLMLICCLCALDRSEFSSNRPNANPIYPK